MLAREFFENGLQLLGGPDDHVGNLAFVAKRVLRFRLRALLDLGVGAGERDALQLGAAPRLDEGLLDACLAQRSRHSVTSRTVFTD